MNLTDETLDKLELEEVSYSEADAIIQTALKTLVEQKQPEIEERMERFEGTRFTDFGKLKMLEEIREEVIGSNGGEE